MRDIHFFVEKKNKQDKWISADKWKYKINEETKKREYYVDQWDSFVRGGGNEEMYEILQSISLAKGLPSDVSNKVKTESDIWGLDGHSHSWLTVSELVGHDWHKGREISGYLDSFNYDYLKSTGLPISYRKKVDKVISEDDMKKFLKKEKDPKFSTTQKEYADLGYCKSTWMASDADRLYYFHYHVLPKIRSLGEPEDVRCIFWFDN